MCRTERGGGANTERTSSCLIVSQCNLRRDKSPIIVQETEALSLSNEELDENLRGAFSAWTIND